MDCVCDTSKLNSNSLQIRLDGNFKPLHSKYPISTLNKSHDCRVMLPHALINEISTIYIATFKIVFPGS